MAFSRYFGVTSTVQPLPLASVVVPPLAELPLRLADEPLAPDAEEPELPLLDDGVEPVVEGDDDEEELLVGDVVLADAPDGLRSAVIISVMPGSTVNVLAFAEELAEPIALLEPLAPDELEPVVALRVPDVDEPLAPVDPPVAPAVVEPELPVVLDPLRPDVEDDESEPVIMMRHGAIVLDALEPDVLEALGELLLLLDCATATAVNMDVDKAARATDERILRILLSSADLGRHANSRQRIEVKRVPVCARLHDRARSRSCAHARQMSFGRWRSGFGHCAQTRGSAAGLIKAQGRQSVRSASCAARSTS